MNMDEVATLSLESGEDGSAVVRIAGFIGLFARQS
jgi:hypothetical protein